MERPSLLCIGHRGAMGHEPENTLRSVRKALELGAPCVEIDVYWVAGHLVVIHDDRLERTTNGTGYVADQSFTYLRSLDAGKGERIPTLEEVCDVVRGKAGLNIELKGPDTAEPVATVIERLVKGGWDKKSLLVSSFDHQELFNMRQLDADIRLGLIAKIMLPGSLDFAESIGVFSIHQYHEYIKPEFVERAHARGIRIYAYTVNKPTEIARMQEMGVDGVFTNYPDRVLEHYMQDTGADYWKGRECTHQGTD